MKNLVKWFPLTSASATLAQAQNPGNGKRVFERDAELTDIPRRPKTSPY